MNQSRIQELRNMLDTESIDYQGLAEISAEFEKIPDAQLRDIRENATATDMLDEIETQKARENRPKLNLCFFQKYTKQNNLEPNQENWLLWQSAIQALLNNMAKIYQN